MNFFKKEYGAFYLVEWKDGYIQLWEDYSNIIKYKEVNWSSFTFINLSFEREYFSDSLEVVVSLLGLNVRLEWNLWNTESSKENSEMLNTRLVEMLDINEQALKDKLKILNKVKELASDKKKLIAFVNKKLKELAPA